MKYIDEFRGPEDCRRLARAIHRTATRPWTLMEVCGGQTHSIVRHGLESLLPETVTLLHGPGCPVCVTAVESIDRGLEVASRPGVIFCAFGDMLRVPGSRAARGSSTGGDLLTVKARGGDVRIVYSPLDAVRIASENPDKEVVFFAVGFETTAPTTAMALARARRAGLENFSMLVAHVLVPPAVEAILSAPDCAVQGFLAAGHVCAVTGYAEYEPIAEKHNTPFVVAGFEPVDILQGILKCVDLLEKGEPTVVNAYGRAVRREGNPQARNLIDDVFEPTDRKWRGIGVIPRSGLRLRPSWDVFDAERRFEVQAMGAAEAPECISGLILQGLRKPPDCPAFGTACTPEHPLGATMVSSEGACAAYYRYRRDPSSGSAP